MNALLLSLFVLADNGCFSVRAPGQGWFGIAVERGRGVEDALYSIGPGDTIVIEEAENQGARLDAWTDDQRRRETVRLTFARGGAQRVRFVFARPLDNMEVDAWGTTATGDRIRLLDEKRMRDRIVEITSPLSPLSGIELVLHRGLRKPPVLERFTLAYTGALPGFALLDPSFTEPGHAYFYTAEAREVRLCPREPKQMTLPAAAILGKRAKLLAR